MSKWVVNCRREQYDVYIGRPSQWGNPFRIGRDGDRDEVIEKYREWLRQRPELVEAAKTQLQGKVLGCWCAPHACHGDVLARLANEPIYAMMFMEGCARGKQTGC